MAAAGPAEAPEAPGMLAGREGFVFGKQPRRGPSIFEVAADNDYMHIFKYRAYRFEMAAAGPGSRGSRHAGRQGGL